MTKWANPLAPTIISKGSVIKLAELFLSPVKVRARRRPEMSPGDLADYRLLKSIFSVRGSLSETCQGRVLSVGVANYQRLKLSLLLLG
jgi:hypothetical protein